MELQIRYARTSDGVNIAYSALGSGPALVVAPPHISHSMQREWEIPSMRAAAETSSRAMTYVRYDPRAAGLSDQYDGRFTIDAFVRDLEAVIDAVSPDNPVFLWGAGRWGMVCVTYAARFPERVAKLVLWSTAATSAEMEVEPLRRLREIAAVDWDLALEANAQAVDSYETPEVARQFAEMMRGSDPQVFLRFEEEIADWDVRSLLSLVRAPTLVMHPKSNRYYPAANAQRIAVAIPNSELHLIDTSSVLTVDRRVLSVSAAFLVGPGAGGATRDGQTSRNTVVILFVDVVDSTGLTEKYGDSWFRDRSGKLEERLRTIIGRSNGRAVEGRTLGDGVLAMFRSAQEAIDAARRSARAGDELDMPVHIGLHAGDVIRETGNIYGGAVNIASRISGLSAPGEILVSDVVRSLARTSAGVTFEDRGEQSLKGIAEPQRVFAVRNA
jgi:class 3 adenylate cyclase/pimeloyl-ACP methyl ester carboxylesterase